MCHVHWSRVTCMYHVRESCVTCMCHGMHVRTDMYGDACQNWHVCGRVSELTCMWTHVRTDMYGDACQNWHVCVTCQKWHVCVTCMPHVACRCHMPHVGVTCMWPGSLMSNYMPDIIVSTLETTSWKQDGHRLVPSEEYKGELDFMSSPLGSGSLRCLLACTWPGPYVFTLTPFCNCFWAHSPIFNG